MPLPASLVPPSADPTRPAFAPAEHEALLAWLEPRRGWLRGAVAWDYGDAEEALSLRLRGASAPRWWLLKTADGGAVEVADSAAADLDGGTFASIAEALEAIDAVADADWSH